MRIQGAGEGLVQADGEDADRVAYILHPNCAVEDVE